MKKALVFIVLVAGCAVPPGARLDPIEVIDLTHTLAEGIPIYPGGTPLSLERTADPTKDGYYMNAVTVGEHTGTHVDAPIHFIAGGDSIDAIPADHLIGPGVVIDVSAKCAADPDYRLDYLDIKEWEAQHGRIPNGAILLIRTGWSQRWEDPESYVNADSGGVLHFPGISLEAAEYLVTYRDVSGVGIDTLSVDHGPSKQLKAHRTLHRKGIFHIENVANLERLPPVGTTIVVAPIPIRGGSGSPCRVFALLSPGVAQTSAPHGGGKYLIEFGWDIPSERTLAEAAVAETPFDGAVFDAELVPGGGKAERFSWKAFGPHVLTDQHVQRIVGDLKGTPAKFRRRSFIRFNVTPGHIDWFDDWTGIMANASGAAKIGRGAGLAGMLLDVEQYQGQIFDYQKRPHGHSFSEYETKARERGSQFIRAINAEHPQIEILLTFGYSIADRDRRSASYGLLPAFLDGMFEACTRGTKIIDGYEFAYPLKTRRAFERGRAEILGDSKGRCQVGFGIWLDWYSAQRGWSMSDFTNNWFSPEEFGTAVSHALDLSDRYVWIYSERLNWWTRENLPDPYLRALEQGK